MRKLALGSFGAALAMFLWGVAFWMCPLPYRSLQRLPDTSDAGEALLAHFPKSGTYMIPGRDELPERRKDLHERGPIGMLHLQRRGQPVLGIVHLQGFLHLGLSGLLIAWLVRLAEASLSTFRSQVKFALLTGITCAVFADATQPVWFLHPGLWHAVLGVYHATAFFLGSLMAMSLLIDVPTPLSRFRLRRPSAAEPETAERRPPIPESPAAPPPAERGA